MMRSGRLRSRLWQAAETHDHKRESPIPICATFRLTSATHAGRVRASYLNEIHAPVLGAAARIIIVGDRLVGTLARRLQPVGRDAVLFPLRHHRPGPPPRGFPILVLAA